MDAEPDFTNRVACFWVVNGRLTGNTIGEMGVVQGGGVARLYCPYLSKFCKSGGFMSKRSDEEIEDLLEQLDDQLQKLSEQSEFGDIYEEVDQVGHLITQLPMAITAVRQRGYVHSGQMEEKLAAYTRRWPQIEPEVKDNIENSVEYLVDYEEDADDDLSKADDTWKNKHLNAARDSVSIFAKEAEKARNDVKSMYAPIYDGLVEIDAELEHIGW
ncbi:MAG: hypothetical protein GY943_39620, partial [Chloroflexi bacterium]|nr:hypothetical protein [Chloroflexota bacterium]